MRWIVTGDVHARNTSEVGGPLIDGLPAALHDTVAFMERLRVAAEEYQAAQVVILGDLVHERKWVDTLVWVHLVRALERLAVPTSILLGNHDIADDAQRLTILESLEHVPDMTVWGQPFDQAIGVGQAMTLVRWVPYMRGEREMRQALAAPDWAHPWKLERVASSDRMTRPRHRIAMVHGMFTGARRGPWDYCGEEHGIPLEAVSMFDLTLAGHVHQSHVIRADGTVVARPEAGIATVVDPGSVLYVGSPYPLNESQLGDACGFWLLDTDTLAVTFVPWEGGPVYASASSAGEIEDLMDRYDPARLHVKTVLLDSRERPKASELLRACRSYSLTALPEQKVDADRAQVAAAPDDQALLARYVAARGVVDIGEPAQVVQEGLALLRLVETEHAGRFGYAHAPLAISRVRMVNWMTIADMTIDLPVRGVVALSGPNGAAKSAVLEAIGFALTGQVMRYGRSAAKAIRAGTTRAVVSLEFVRADDAGEYRLAGRIVRELVGDAGQTVTANLNGVDLTGDTYTDRQAQLDAYLGLDMALWRSAYHFIPKWSFLDQGDDEKKEIIDRLTGAGRFTAASDEARSVSAEVGAKLHDLTVVRERLLGVLRTAGLVTAGALEAEQAATGQQAAVVADLQAKCAEALREWEQATAAYRQAVVARDQAGQAVRAADYGLATLRAQVGDDPAARIGEALVKIDECRKAADKAAAAAQSARQGVCPTCLRPGISADRAVYLAAVVDQADTEHKSWQNMLQAAHEAKAGYDKAVQDMQPLVDAATSAAAVYARCQAETQHQYDLVEAARRRCDEWGRLSVEAATRAASTKVDLVQLVGASQAVKELFMVYAERAKLSRRQAIVEFWRTEGFGRTGVRSYLLEGIFPWINRQLYEYTSALSNGRLWLHLTATSSVGKRGREEVRDRIGTVVGNDAGSALLEGNSNGERTRYDLGVMVAFADYARTRSGAVPLDYLALDEVLKHLDAEGRARAIPFLRRIGETRLVLLVEHDPQLVAAIDHQIELAKVDGVSVIVRSTLASAVGEAVGSMTAAASVAVHASDVACGCVGRVGA